MTDDEKLAKKIAGEALAKKVREELWGAVRAYLAEGGVSPQGLLDLIDRKAREVAEEGVRELCRAGRLDECVRRVFREEVARQFGDERRFAQALRETLHSEIKEMASTWLANNIAIRTVEGGEGAGSF